MNKRRSKTVSAVLVTLAVAVLTTVASVGAEPPPYGHPGFVPTPEKPIHFRPNNGHYPGATPPLEWWDGTPVNLHPVVGVPVLHWSQVSVQPTNVREYGKEKTR